MSKSESYIRYPRGISEEKLANKLGLYWSKYEQDWELIVSDFGRIPDFLKLYQKELDNDDDKFTLMGLIVSSFDDNISNFDKETQINWNICKTILEKECYLHYSIINYWCLLEKDPDDLDVFDITPHMREIWEKVKTKFE